MPLVNFDFYRMLFVTTNIFKIAKSRFLITNFIKCLFECCFYKFLPEVLRFYKMSPRATKAKNLLECY